MDHPSMRIIRPLSAESLAEADTAELRERHLFGPVLTEGEIRTVYVAEDRLILGGAVPQAQSLALKPEPPVMTSAFLTGREVGILHTGGGRGAVTVDGVRHELDFLDMLYVGRGDRTVEFSSVDSEQPARFYFASTTAHRTCPDKLVRQGETESEVVGSESAASKRRLNPVIVPGNVETSQLLMGFTEVLAGSVWNTIPPHVHDRRVEPYFYFEIPDDERVFHLLGDPSETRHIVVKQGEGVAGGSFCIQAGVGTTSYRFCWATAGENNDYDDVDVVPVTDLT